MKNLRKILTVVLRSIKSGGLINTLNKIFTGDLYSEEYGGLKPIKTRGLIDTIKLFRYYYLFEVKYSTKTKRWVFPDDLNVERKTPEHGTKYYPFDFLSLYRIFKFLPVDFKVSVFLDLGCGKGRPLLVALEHGFRKVIGVEYDKNLCDICLNNLKNYAHSKNYDCNYEVINIDASLYDVDDYVNVVLLFNPFDDYILDKVLSNINISIKRKNRILYIVYCNPVHEDKLSEEYHFFCRVDEKTIIYRLAYE